MFTAAFPVFTAPARPPPPAEWIRRAWP